MVVLEQRGIREMRVLAFASAFSPKVVTTNRRVLVAAGTVGFVLQVPAADLGACRSRFFALVLLNSGPAAQVS